MFPRTRRCLTGTYTRPIVTVRTSKFPSPFTASPWCRQISETAPQAAPLPRDGGPKPDHDQVPHPDTVDAWTEVPTDDSTTPYITPQLYVSRLIQSRESRLPRARLAGTHGEIDQDIVPTYRTTRKDLNTQPLPVPAPKSHGFAPKPIEWLPLAQFLAKIPPTARQNTQELIQLDREKMHTYTGSYRPNAWSETVGAGVHVQLAADPQSMSRSAILTGSEYYNGIVLDKFLDRGAEDAHKPGAFGEFLADDLKSINSIAAFTRFVYRLTNKFVNRNVENELYHSYNRYAGDILCWMFTDPVMSTYASTVALNRALIFLHSHTELLPAAELVFVEGQSRFLAQNITTLNLRLSFALRHGFATMAYAAAREMMDREIQPNSRTWSLIYSALPLRWERQELVKLIRQTDTDMTDSAWSRLASATLEEWLQRAGKDAQKLNNVVASLDEAFGSAWLNIEVVHKALQICTRRKLFNVARRFSDLAEARGVAPLWNSHVDSFALFCRRMDIDGAIDLLKAMDTKGEDVHHKLVIPYMFMTAWERQRTNLCHLLWIFAATRGIISRTMRSVVTKALLSNTRLEAKREYTNPAQIRRSAWQQMTARVICGLDESTINHGTDGGRCFPRLRSYILRTAPEPLNMAEMIMKWTPDDGTRDEQLSLIYVMIGADMNAWKSFDHMSQDVLIEQLPLADERDQRWASVVPVRKDTHVARRESRRALEHCIPNRASGEWSERVWRIRQVVLRNLETAELQPTSPTDALGVEHPSAPTISPREQEHVLDAADKPGDEVSRPTDHETPQGS